MTRVVFAFASKTMASALLRLFVSVVVSIAFLGCARYPRSLAFSPHLYPLRHHARTWNSGLETAFPQFAGLTDWVVENLEGGELGSVTSSSASKAGENDTLPSRGLCLGAFRILPADAHLDSIDDTLTTIKLLVGRNGWGTGVHPTTRLCLEWLGAAVQDGDTLLDYGCGSGILSIASLHIGAARAIGVDVEAEALITSVRNTELNGCVLA